MPDVVQSGQAGHATLNGDGRQEHPVASQFLVSGQLSRNAGADLGSYALAWTNNLGAAAFAGSLRVLHFEGQAAYTRDRTRFADP